MSMEKNNLFNLDLSEYDETISKMIGEDTDDSADQNTGDIIEDTNIDVNDNLDTNNVDNDNIDDVDQDEEDTDPLNDTDDDQDTNKGDDQEGDDEDSNTTSLTPYAKLLVEEGILPNLDLEKFDGTAESLIEAARNEIYNGINSYKENLPDEIKTLINGYEAGVPFDQLLEYNKSITKYSQIDENSLSESEELQKQILKDYYKKTSKFSDEKIDKLIERSADLGELFEEASASLKELVEIQKEEEQLAIEEARKQQEQMLEQQKAQLEEFNKTVDNIKEIIPGLKVSDTLKNKIKKNITTPVAYDQYGNPLNKIGKYRLENPIQFEITLNYLFELTNGFTNFEVLGKTGKSKAFKELEEAAKSISSSDGGRAATSKPMDSDIKKSIEGFMSNFRNGY